MSRIDELIAQHCPDGVKFFPMWQLTTWDKRFNAVDRHKQPRIEKYRYLLAKELSPLSVDDGDVKILTTNESDLWTTEKLVDGPIHEAEIVAIPWGGNAIVQHYSGRFVTSDNRIAIANDPEQLDMKFLYYFISNNIAELASFYRGSGIKHPSMTKVLDWLVPVPPLEVQRAIVEVLDTFSKLEAELEAELEARKQQYEHYREQLFLSSKSAVMRPLHEICESISAGGDRPTNHVKGQTTPTDEMPYPIYSNGTGDAAIYGFTDSFRISKRAVTISARGTIGAHAIREAFFTPVIRLLVLIPNEEQVNIRYLNYALDMTELGHSGGSIPQLTVPNVKKIKIPVPPLDEQNHIADTLDKFDALVNDLSVGLPAELSARRQQYEYYRDKLLTFKELEPSS